MSDTMNNEEYEDEDEDTVTITLEDGSEVNCDIIATFPIGDKDYIALLPDRVIDGYDEDDVYLYRYEKDKDGDIELFDIEDDDEFEAVADRFDELMDEEEFDEM